MLAVSIENHRRQLPLIYARTLLRSQLKAAASFAATRAVHNSGHHGGTQDAIELGMILAGLAFVSLTEKADLRCWVFLPARADVGLLKLPPGEHRLRVEYLSATGGLLYAGPWRTITVPGKEGTGGGLVTIVEHFWR